MTRLIQLTNVKAILDHKKYQEAKGYPWHPVVKTAPSMQRAQILSLVKELDLTCYTLQPINLRKNKNSFKKYQALSVCPLECPL